MREQKFWSLYAKVVYNERYFFYYRERALKLDRCIKLFLCAASLSSVASLAFWNQVPLIWAVVSAAAQLLSAMAYLIPYSDQINALNNLLPELSKLIDQIDYLWDQIGISEEITDAEINALVLCLNMELTDLENRYTKGIPFSPSKKCIEKAIRDREDFIKNRFPPDEPKHSEEELSHV